MNRTLLVRLCLSTALALTGGAAMAQETAAILPEVPAPVAAAPVAKAVTESQLEALSGGFNTHTAIALTEQDLTAVNTGNTISANSVGSGAISLQDNALSGFSGIGNFMMNTGHNNNLQSSMSVTIIVTN